MELPSTGELEGLSEEALALAELDFESMTWREIWQAYRAFCNHPVVRFARVACDMVEPFEEDEDATAHLG